MKKNNTILIIDDDEELIEELSKILVAENYDVIAALSGEEGLEKFKTNQVKLVLLDIKLPKMDGVSVYQEMLKINPEVLVIVITGSFDRKKSQELLERGAKAVIEKPFDVEELLREIKNIFIINN